MPVHILAEGRDRCSAFSHFLSDWWKRRLKLRHVQSRQINTENSHSHSWNEKPPVCVWTLPFSIKVDWSYIKKPIKANIMKHYTQETWCSWQIYYNTWWAFVLYDSIICFISTCFNASHIVHGHSNLRSSTVRELAVRCQLVAILLTFVSPQNYCFLNGQLYYDNLFRKISVTGLLLTNW